jgi:predicted Zn-dependent protease
MLAHFRIARSANIQAELFIVDGAEPNAFAGLHAGRRIIGINVGMVKLIGDDIDEYAALIGHETAHWAKGHVDSGQVRTNALNAVGTLVGAGLGLAGVPAGGLIAVLGVDLIDASYSRDTAASKSARPTRKALSTCGPMVTTRARQSSYMKRCRAPAMVFTCRFCPAIRAATSASRISEH